MPRRETFRVDIGDGRRGGRLDDHPARPRSRHGLPAADVRLRRTLGADGPEQLGPRRTPVALPARPATVTWWPASTTAAPRRRAAASGASRSTARSASCVGRPGGGGPGIARHLRLHRPQPHRIVGLERRRHHDLERPLPLPRALHHGHGGRLGPRPEALRHRLPGTLHGPARGQRRGLRTGLADHPRRSGSKAISCWSTAPATTTSTSRVSSC